MGTPCSIRTLCVCGRSASSLIGACGHSSLQDEVWTLPDQNVQSLVGVHTPQWLGTLPRQAGGWVERRQELVLQGNSPKCPQGSFSLWKNPSAQSCGSLRTRKGLSSHTAYLSSWARDCVSGWHTAQMSTLPSLHPQSPWVYHFVLIHPSVTSSNQVSHGVAQTLVGRGASC